MVKVFLDPGHGGTDDGAQANGLKEKNLTLAIAKRIEAILVNEIQNVTVRMSRSSDQTVSLKERTDHANRWGADYYLSIHINAGGGLGYEDYIYNKLANSSRTSILRDSLHSEIIKLNGMNNRGKKKANFHVLRETKMSAMLTENGFIDNAKDAAKMKQNSWLDQVARGHVNGLVKAFDLKRKTTNTIPTKYLEIITDALWTYHSPNWDDRAVIVKKGEVFTVIKDKFRVGSGLMYQIKSGLYITASPLYVREYSKL